ncbi:MAG TPA: glutathione transferase GstA [Polyangiaceae bacterium]|nr:glutathione transferase GstA [Polyangiaceae bacterium]
MKLYISPGSCSLSPHIALREAGLTFDLEKVMLATRKTEGGVDFALINPKGYVPVLELDDGQRLTEGVAIVQYIADQKPASKLAPPAGSFERYRFQETLTFISTELHKTFAPLFNPKTPAEYKTMSIERIGQRFDYLSKELAGKAFLMGDTFTVADGYLFTILNWTNFVGIDLGRWPTLKEYHGRVASRPNVRAALEAEGLVK